MKILHLALLLGILSLINNQAESRCLSPNQIEVCNNDFTKCFCKKCLSCPPGYGLNYECTGKQINIKQTLKCVLCDLGATYSSTNSSAMCQPCPHCEGHKMLHPCTTISETKCSPDQCDKGFVWSSMLEMCELGQKQTSSTSKLTPPKSSTPTATPIIHGFINASTPESRQTVKPTKNLPPESAEDESSGKENPSSTSDLHNTTPIMVIVILVVIVAIIATFLFVKRKKIYQFCKKRFSSEEIGTVAAEESFPLNKLEGGSEEPSPELTRHNQAYPWSPDILLRGIPHDLRSPIETKITCPEPPKKGWRPLGKELNLEEDTLDNINNHRQEEKGKQLFVALEGEQPKLTLSTFVDALFKLRRIDIVEFVKDYYNYKF